MVVITAAAAITILWNDDDDDDDDSLQIINTNDSFIVIVSWSLIKPHQYIYKQIILLIDFWLSIIFFINWSHGNNNNKTFWKHIK